MLEDCVNANRRDWGRKGQVERQAVSDCSEEKYETRFIPWRWSLFVCFVGCFIGRLFGLCGELNFFLCAVTSISTIRTSLSSILFISLHFIFVFILDRFIDYSVSSIKNIKQACQPFIEKYDTCLSQNKSNPLSCIQVLRDVTPHNPIIHTHTKDS